MTTHAIIDTEGKRHLLNFTIGTLDRIRRKTGVDLLVDNPGLEVAKLSDDPRAFVDALGCLCGGKDLIEVMDGESIGSAVEPFVEGLTDFFLNSRPAVGKVLQATWKKHREVQQRAGEIMERKIAGPEADAAISAQLKEAEQRVDQRLLDMQSGGSPESSESTPSP